MKAGSIKGIATKDTNSLDINSLKEPRYPQNKMYREFYKKGLKNQEDIEELMYYQKHQHQ